MGIKTNYGVLPIEIDAKGKARVRGGESKTRAAGERSAVHRPACESGINAETTTRTLQNGSSPAYRSKLEAAWAEYLSVQARVGEIAAWWYEPLNLRLPGKRNWYKPDFLVLAGDGLTFYEVKGRNKSDDRSLVKMKTAAGLNRWAKFVLVKRRDGIWDERVIDAA